MNIRCSQLGAILGLDPWCSPYEAWRRIRGLVPTEVKNPQVMIGKELEPLILREWEEQTGGRVLERQVKVSQVQPFPLTGTLDAVGEYCGERVVVEAKWSSSEQLPQSYEVQVMAYMALAGINKAHLAVRRPNKWTETLVVEFDPSVWSQILGVVNEWYERYVIGDTPPPAETPQDQMTAVTGKTKIPTPRELEKDVNELIELERQRETIEQQITQVRGRLLSEFAARNISGIFGTWGTLEVVTRRGHVAWKAVADQLGALSRPDIVEKHRGENITCLVYRKKGGEL